MLDRVQPHEMLDHGEFARSLSLEQAAALLMYLKVTKHAALAPLKAALEYRVRQSPIKHRIGQRVMDLFGKRRS
jgi:hypothetical protein